MKTNTYATHQTLVPYGFTATLLSSFFLIGQSYQFAIALPPSEDPSQDQIRQALASHSISVSPEMLNGLTSQVRPAHAQHCAHIATGNSKVSFLAVQIAQTLGLNPKVDGTALDRVKAAITEIPCPQSPRCVMPSCSSPAPTPVSRPHLAWEEYFRKVVNLTSDQSALNLLTQRGFHPVKISWEDIGRYEGSVWGDRISDVGIWVRKDEADLSSAELALSVRRDSNYRDKVLVVPADAIKIHLSEGSDMREVSLPARLKELSLTSKEHDTNVIVSNQFAIVPVPAANMRPMRRPSPPRAAFNFSIFPYGSTNYVITDVIEGSSDAIVGAGGHQLLFANVDGKKAPFTASRAEDRKDLLELEGKLKAKGMDVDVQRYYLIQIPLRKDTSSIVASNMGTPPVQRFGGVADYAYLSESVAALGSAPSAAGNAMKLEKSSPRGLNKVAIGHGESEGEYSRGTGFEGMRAEEPVRVTVVYFVTPVGEVTSQDLDTFSEAFSQWDEKAIWGGSFVTK